MSDEPVPGGTSNLREESSFAAAFEDLLAGHPEALRALFDRLQIGIFILNASGRILLHNEAARRIWGGTRLVGPLGVAIARETGQVLEKHSARTAGLESGVHRVASGSPIARVERRYVALWVVAGCR